MLNEKTNENPFENPSEIETVILDGREVAETFNNFFLNIVPSLKGNFAPRKS